MGINNAWILKVKNVVNLKLTLEQFNYVFFLEPIIYVLI